jgi:glycosyltransferase involved in cell wall biosynthesis
VTSSSVGIVVPTLGEREDYLRLSLKSIRAAGSAYISVVAPESFRTNQVLVDFSVDQFVIDPGTGLVNAINKAIHELPIEISYVNWLGDDDQLAPNSIEISKAQLEANPRMLFSYGQCKYINENGSVVGINKSGNWATKIIFFGPDLIPQPGALIRKSALAKIGNLDNSFTHAFDMDMFMKLLKIGKGIYINQWVASFRWHSGSLSVNTRKKSVTEASRIRRHNLPAGFRVVAILWEIPLSIIVFAAGYLVNMKSRRIKK